MAKQRSPNCPQVTFLDTVTKARTIYTKEHTHPADKNILAEHLGYTSISGASATALGALRQYGLLEAAGDGLRISEEAVDYFELPEDAPERRHAIAKMILHPASFRELWDQYEGKLPSDANLRHSLIKRGFLPKTAEEVLRVYKENCKLLVGVDLEYTDQEDTTEMTTAPDTTRPSSVRMAVSDERSVQIPAGSTSISTPVGKDEGGNAVFAHVRFDSALRKEFVTGLKKYLDYLETTLN